MILNVFPQYKKVFDKRRWHQFKFSFMLGKWAHNIKKKKKAPHVPNNILMLCRYFSDLILPISLCIWVSFVPPKEIIKKESLIWTILQMLSQLFLLLFSFSKLLYNAMTQYRFYFQVELIWIAYHTPSRSHIWSFQADCKLLRGSNYVWKL